MHETSTNGSGNALGRCLIGLYCFSFYIISFEVFIILLTIIFASALSTEILGVKPERKEIMVHWKKNWKKLFPEQKRNWKIVFKENKKELISFVIIILVLLLFGAWFEVLI